MANARMEVPNIDALPWVHRAYDSFRHGVHVVAHQVNDVHPETGEHDPGWMTKLEEISMLLAFTLLLVYAVGIHGAKREREEAERQARQAKLDNLVLPTYSRRRPPESPVPWSKED